MALEMELNHLRHFYYVAKFGGFTRASKKLRVAQPSITRSVKRLEEDLGVHLLERAHRVVSLTKVGREVFQSCERIFAEAENIRVFAASEREECKGPVRFAASQAISSGLVPAVNGIFLKKHPEAWPMTYVGPASASLARIESADLEFGLLFHVPKTPEKLRVEKFASVPHRLVIGARFAGNLEVRRSFIGSREIDDPGQDDLPTLRRLKREDPQTRIRVSSNDLECHRQMVFRGLGVAILPEFLVSEDLERGRLKALFPKEDFLFDIHLVARKAQVLSRAARSYLEELRAFLSFR